MMLMLLAEGRHLALALKGTSVFLLEVAHKVT